MDVPVKNVYMINARCKIECEGEKEGKKEMEEYWKVSNCSMDQRKYIRWRRRWKYWMNGKQEKKNQMCGKCG